MLTPKQLREIADTMYPILDELNTWIASDVIKRLMARLGRGEGAFFTETDKWQLELYKEAAGHYEALEREIKRWTKKADAEVKAIFEDAGLKAWKADDAFYTRQGYESISLLKSETLMRMLTDAYQRTQGEIHNFTRTTAEHSQQRFIKVCDSAHFRVMTGAQGYTQAVRDAVEELADAGQLRVKYPTGHSDTIETAVLRCVRTGAAQASGSLAIQGMIEHDWDVILVSAHLGARYGDGGENPGNHFWWQGKFYSRTGKTPELPLFKETGYGTGEGLSGWNCRHSFGPGNPGYNPYEKYDTEENRAAYDLSQKQRAMEARIRRMKTKLLGYKTSIANCGDPKLKKELQADYDRLAQKLSARNSAYNEFCENNNLRPYNDRLQVAKWNRAEATRAAKAAARADKAGKGGIAKVLTGQSAGDSGQGAGGKHIPSVVSTLETVDRRSVDEVFGEVRKTAEALPYEVNFTVTSDGRVWYTKGDKANVYPDLIETVCGQSLENSYSYHNHPADVTHFSFSADDVGFFFKYKQLVSEASDTEYRYVMERLSGTADLSYEEAKDLFYDIYNIQVLRMAYDGNLNIDLNGYHEAMKLLAQRLDFKYERTKNDG